MAWTTPKTDWSVGTSSVSYNGDRFTYKDFNRIKNNIDVLFTLAGQLYDISSEVARRVQVSTTYAQNHYQSGTADYFILADGYNDRTASSYVYADELNYFEYRLDFINQLLEYPVSGKKKTFYPNDIFINATELNRLETICLKAYKIMNNSKASRRKLAITLTQNRSYIDLGDENS